MSTNQRADGSPAPEKDLTGTFQTRLERFRQRNGAILRDIRDRSLPVSQHIDSKERLAWDWLPPLDTFADVPVEERKKVFLQRLRPGHVVEGTVIRASNTELSVQITALLLPLDGPFPPTPPPPPEPRHHTPRITPHETPSRTPSHGKLHTPKHQQHHQPPHHHHHNQHIGHHHQHQYENNNYPYHHHDEFSAFHGQHGHDAPAKHFGYAQNANFHSNIPPEFLTYGIYSDQQQQQQSQQQHHFQNRNFEYQWHGNQHHPQNFEHEERRGNEISGISGQDGRDGTESDFQGNEMREGGKETEFERNEKKERHASRNEDGVFFDVRDEKEGVSARKRPHSNREETEEEEEKHGSGFRKKRKPERGENNGQESDGGRRVPDGENEKDESRRKKKEKGVEEGGKGEPKEQQLGISARKGSATVRPKGVGRRPLRVNDLRELKISAIVPYPNPDRDDPSGPGRPESEREDEEEGGDVRDRIRDVVDVMDGCKVDDDVRAVVVSVDATSMRVDVSMDSSKLLEDYSGPLPRLGRIVREEANYNIHYRHGETYMEHLGHIYDLRNPRFAEELQDIFAIDPNMDTFIQEYKRVDYPPGDYMDPLRETQDKAYALSRVASGVELYMKGKSREALDCYNQALDLHPTNTDALVARGAWYANEKRFDPAITDLESALKIDAKHSNATNYLATTLLARAKTYEMAGRTADAYADLRRCVELAPNNEEAVVRFEALQSRLMDIQKAKKAKKQAEKEKEERSKMDLADKLRMLLRKEEEQGDSRKKSKKTKSEKKKSKKSTKKKSTSKKKKSKKKRSRRDDSGSETDSSESSGSGSD